MAKIEIRGFDNLGFSQITFDGPELEPIRSEIRRIQSNFEMAQKHNQFLAGNIRREYLLKDSKNYISDLLYPFLLEYNDFHKNWVVDTARSIGRKSGNPQKKSFWRKSGSISKRNMNLIHRILTMEFLVLLFGYRFHFS